MKTEALKLADWLDKSIDTDDWGELAKYYQWCHENVSPMIRRLVEELDALNAKESMWQEMIEDLECQVIKYKQGEPVAWGWKDQDGDICDCITPYEHSQAEGCYTIPLYTTPQTKPLSDSEIQKIADDVCYLIDKDKKGRSKGAMYIEDFARAIEERHGIK